MIVQRPSQKPRNKDPMKTKELVGQDVFPTLYKKQIRSQMEFAPLTWGGSPESHLKCPDAMQRRAEKIIQRQNEGRLDSLHRDTSPLLFKTTMKQSHHLYELRTQPSVTNCHQSLFTASSDQQRLDLPVSKRVYE